jgi:hypothetical protein
MVTRALQTLAVLSSLLAFACGKSAEENPAGAAPSTATPSAPALTATAPTPPPGAKVFFVSPTDGATVTGPLVEGKVNVPVKMGVEGIALEAAGAQKQGSGHHHIIVDGDLVAMGTPVPKDETHLHYGQAQSEAQLMLTPGPHTLTMQFADGAHMSYGPELSRTIKITVSADAAKKPTN